MLDGPVITNSEWHALCEHLGEDAAMEIDCEAPADGGTQAMIEALDRISWKLKMPFAVDATCNAVRQTL